jgi:hypothetical protein
MTIAMRRLSKVTALAQQNHRGGSSLELHPFVAIIVKNLACFPDYPSRKEAEKLAVWQKFRIFAPLVIYKQY